MVLTLVARLALPLLVALVASARAHADEAAKAELLAHAKRLADAKSYVVEYSGSSARGDEEGGDDRGGRAAGRGGDPWKVEFERGQPVHYLRGRYDFWFGEKRISFKDPKEKWTTIDRPDRSAPAVEGAEEPRVFKAIDEIERIPLPHLLVADLASSVTDVAREESDDGVVYVATLTSDAARRFGGLKPRKAAARKPDAPAGEPPQQGAEPVGRSKEPECAGTLRVTVVDDVVETLEADVTVKAANERRVTRTLAISGLDASPVVLPPEVAAAHATQ
jgi:hypothetical protein